MNRPEHDHRVPRAVERAEHLPGLRASSVPLSACVQTLGRIYLDIIALSGSDM